MSLDIRPGNLYHFSHCYKRKESGWKRHGTVSRGFNTWHLVTLRSTLRVSHSVKLLFELKFRFSFFTFFVVTSTHSYINSLKLLAYIYDTSLLSLSILFHLEMFSIWLTGRNVLFLSGNHHHHCCHKWNEEMSAFICDLNRKIKQKIYYIQKCSYKKICISWSHTTHLSSNLY